MNIYHLSYSSGARGSQSNNHHLREFLVSSSSPEGGISLAVCMPSVCSVIQLLISLGCRNPPSPEIALLPESVAVGEEFRQVFRNFCEEFRQVYKPTN